MMSGGGDGNPELLPCSESLPQLRAVVYRAVFNPKQRFSIQTPLEAFIPQETSGRRRFPG